MGNSANPFFSWLASQPAFVEVGLGMMFCLVIAPVLLALVAAGLTSLEGMLGRILSQSGVLVSATEPSQSLQHKWESFVRAVWQELPWLRKPSAKRQA